jgi:Beta galactosidase small chain
VRIAGHGGGAVRETIFKKEVRVPTVAPRKSQTWEIAVSPDEARTMDWAQLTIRDKVGTEVGRWHLPNYAVFSSDDSEMFQSPATASTSNANGRLIARAGETSATFDEKTGELLELSRKGAVVFSGKGPQFVAFKRQQREFVSVVAPTKLTTTEPAKLLGGGEQQRVTFTYEGNLRSVQWDIGPDLVTLRYEFAIDGELDIAGIRFDLPDTAFKSKRWLGRGPYRVWQNRQEGGVFDLHEVAFNESIPGQTYAYPEFKGFFRDWRWHSLETTAGRITVENASSVPFFALGKIPSGEKDLITDWPDMGLAFLHAIPAIGTKFDSPEVLGPQSQPAKLNGVQRGSLIFRFETE